MPPIHPDLTAYRGKTPMTDDQIKHMAERFLSWKLPANFNPDAGISFKSTFNEHTAHEGKHQPTGTNLFDYTQAEAMVRHMVEGLHSAEGEDLTGLQVQVAKIAPDYPDHEIWYVGLPAGQWRAVAKPDALMAEMLEALKASRSLPVLTMEIGDALPGEVRALRKEYKAIDHQIKAVIAKAEASPSQPIGGR